MQPIFSKLPNFDAKDNFYDRRGRLLDYLLSLYGEKFTQSSLRNFNYYYSGEEMNRVLINNKIKYLKNIVDVNKRKASGFDYLKTPRLSENITGLQLKVSILLGLEFHRQRSLTDVFTHKGLQLIFDREFTTLKEGSLKLEFAGFDTIQDRIETEFYDIPMKKRLKGETGDDRRKIFQDIILLKNNIINDSFLRFGIHLDRYRMGSLDSDHNYQVVFRPYEGAEWCYLATYGDKDEAIESINIFRRLLLRLNILSEGFHIVEHILLRPGNGEKWPRLDDLDEFYSFKVSVLLPSWTARFHNKKFRQLAEETVRINCPAHIFPEFYWLDFKEMHQFEMLHKKWLIEKLKIETSNNDRGNKTLDDYSMQLVEFLKGNLKFEI